MSVSRLSALFPVVVIGLLISGCENVAENPMDEIMPPVAKVEPVTYSIHGHDRVDNYSWIRDDRRSDPQVLALLEAENNYTRQMMAHSSRLQDELYTEITARLTSEDSTVPVKRGDYLYHREFRSGGEYPVYLRRGLEESSPEILLDVNKLAEGHDYYNVGNWVVSKQDVLAFATDDVSRRIYNIEFKNLKTGEMLPDVIGNASTSLAWANDGKTIFYVRKNPETLLPNRVYKHQLGKPVSSDQLVYEETDQSFYTSVYKTRSEEYVVISLQSTDSSEIRLIDADAPDSSMQIFLARENDHEYQVRHVKGSFYIRTNWLADNFRLMKVDDRHLGDKALWQGVVEHKNDVLIQDVEIFDDYLVVDERFDALTRLRVIDRNTGNSNVVKFLDPAYTVHLHSNPEINATSVRYVYSSLTTPRSVFDYDMRTGISTLLKRDEVVGDFDPGLYKSERIAITSRDGTKVPVSLVYRKNLKTKGKNPLYAYAYGSYGYSANPGFVSKRLSLLDRGFVFAMIHVRGGEEKGRDWYEQGRLLNKRNTFWDFIDATEELVTRGYGSQDKVFAMGGSAGGLLMGVIANEAPEKYLGIVAHVPFVDVVSTMLDESIPLTTGEFTEWGDPKVEDYYHYMLSYSPYDQIKEQSYPHMFVTTGLHDSQVQYFEPVKWVSKLRQQKQDNNRLLLDINMDTGHGGASGRYERYRTDALEYAFILDVLDDAG